MSLPASDTSTTFCAGAVKRPITPTVQGRTVFMGGYGRRRLATAIHDELWMCAVAIRYGGVTTVVISLDLVGLFREDVELIETLAFPEGSPDTHVLLTCTGNHAGPDTLGLWGKGRVSATPNDRYMEFLRAEVAGGIHLAIDALEPAQVRAARVDMPGVPGGWCGGELSVLCFETREGRPIATLVNANALPRVMDETNTAISADFVHWLRLDLERSRDSVVAYVCASAARSVPADLCERTWEETECAGRQLAAAVHEAVAHASPVSIDRLEVWQRPVTIPPGKHRSWRFPGASVLQPAAGKGRTESLVSVVQLGPVRIALVPGVVPPEFAAEIRKLLDAPQRCVVSLTNDSLGVIGMPDGSVGPSRPDQRRCEPGYPALAGPHAATIIRDEIANLMLDVRGG